MITVVCVLRSGGDFGPGHARRLYDNVRSHLDCHFICLTDFASVEDVPRQSLVNDWPGWWSMLEMFRVPGPAIYLDLDTVIVGDLTAFAAHVERMADDEVLLLQDLGRHRRRFTTGITAWHGDLRDVYLAFAEVAQRGEFQAARRMGSIDRAGPLLVDGHMIPHDEAWTPVALTNRGLRVNAIQDVLPGCVESYKNDTRPRAGGEPESPVVCFHGSPRPWEVENPPEWLREAVPA